MDLTHYLFSGLRTGPLDKLHTSITRPDTPLENADRSCRIVFRLIEYISLGLYVRRDGFGRTAVVLTTSTVVVLYECVLVLGNVSIRVNMLTKLLVQVKYMALASWRRSMSQLIKIPSRSYNCSSMYGSAWMI